jgi:hypothetical protein
VGIGWVLFGSNSFAAAGRFLAGLFSLEQMAWLPVYLPPVLGTAGLVFAIDLAGRFSGKIPSRLAQSARPILLVAGLVVVTGLVSLSLARGAEIRPFIYGRF